VLSSIIGEGRVPGLPQSLRLWHCSKRPPRCLSKISWH